MSKNNALGLFHLCFWVSLGLLWVFQLPHKSETWSFFMHTYWYQKNESRGLGTIEEQHLAVVMRCLGLESFVKIHWKDDVNLQDACCFLQCSAVCFFWFIAFWAGQRFLVVWKWVKCWNAYGINGRWGEICNFLQVLQILQFVLAVAGDFSFFYWSKEGTAYFATCWEKWKCRGICMDLSLHSSERIPYRNAQCNQSAELLLSNNQMHGCEQR